jgi:hypothetical protein
MRHLIPLTLALGCAPIAPPPAADVARASPGAARAAGDPATDPTLPMPVCVNELMANNVGSFKLPDGSSPDWIELANVSESDIDLTGWQIRDADDNADPTPLDGLRIDAGGYLLLYADGVTDLGPAHLPFQLSSDGESVRIDSPDGRQARVTFYESTRDFVYMRATDCCYEADCWRAQPYGTPGQSNTPP